jgi:hypothetical protein
MARKRKTEVVSRASPRAVTVRDKDGELVRVEMPEAVDLRVPQKDDKTGVATEFVNITRRVQLVPVPDQPGETFMIPPMGVLKGAQWKHLAAPAPKAWGGTPYFMERVLKGKKYDPKYLLTEEQMLDQINRLGNKERIRILVQNAVINEELVDDYAAVTRLGYREAHQGPIMYVNLASVDARPRQPDDRKEVTGAAMQRTYFLEDQERRAQEADASADVVQQS